MMSKHPPHQESYISKEHLKERGGARIHAATAGWGPLPNISSPQGPLQANYSNKCLYEEGGRSWTTARLTIPQTPPELGPGLSSPGAPSLKEPTPQAPQRPPHTKRKEPRKSRSGGKPKLPPPGRALVRHRRNRGSPTSWGNHRLL